MSGSETEDAKAERRAAARRLTDKRIKGGTKFLDRTNDARLERSGGLAKDEKLTLKIKIISLLRELGREPFSMIDQILHFPPGEARKTYEKHNTAYKSWTKKHASEALHRFYTDQITVLEILSKASPDVVKYWYDKLYSIESSETTKGQAAKEIKDWTKIFLGASDSSGLRELIPKACLEAHDEAEAMGGHLKKMLGSAVDLDHETDPS